MVVLAKWCGEGDSGGHVSSYYDKLMVICVKAYNVIGLRFKRGSRISSFQRSQMDVLISLDFLNFSWKPL